MNVSSNGQDRQNVGEPIEKLGTTIDRFTKVNLLIAVAVMVFLGTGVWNVRGFVDSVNKNTDSMDKMTVMMEEVLRRIESNTQSASENRGRIQGIENEMDLLRKRYPKE